MGAGAALIIHILSGDASLQNIMAGMTGLVLSVQAFCRSGGFIRGFVSSLLRRFGGSNEQYAAVNRLIAGLGAGFALSLPLSVVPLSGVAYLMGALLAAAAAAVRVLSGRTDEELIEA